ncbi:MAG TPA: PAS domain S-box protein [Burkholderiales bacterium]|nr:PAS domain S-box protein [Burkholderiales bacterium]
MALATTPPLGATPIQAAPAAGQFYQLIADTIPHMVWTARADGWLDFFNRRCHEYTGLAYGELEGWSWKRVIHDGDWDRCLARWTRALQSGERYDVEYRLRRADGVYRWHHGTAVPMRDEQGRVVRWFGTCTDIESQVRSAQILEGMMEERTRALRDTERRFQAFMDHLPAQAWIRDRGFRYRYVNGAYARANGVTPEAMIGREPGEFFSEEFVRFFRDTDEKVLRDGAPMQWVDGLPSGRWLKVKFPIPSTDGEAAVAGIAVDVTERVKAEERARRYLEDVRTLMGRLVAAQESERRRIARDLHDLIGQNLTALGIGLATLKEHPSPQVRDAVTPRVDTMASLVEGTIAAIRGVMTELRPAALEEFGLVPALRLYAASFTEQTGMAVTVSAPGEERRLPRDVELALFRIAQEALTNAAKHSGGNAASIQVLQTGGVVRLWIEDDGLGFANRVGAREAQRGGWGLPAMRERAEALGGTLRVEFPGRGTRLVVDIPVSRAD